MRIKSGQPATAQPEVNWCISPEEGMIHSNMISELISQWHKIANIPVDHEGAE